VSRSWVPVPAGSGFTLANLPFGAGAAPGRREPSVFVAIGERAVSLGALDAAGLLRVDVPPGACAASSLNVLLAAGRDVVDAVRGRVAELLTDGEDELRVHAAVDDIVVPIDAVTLGLPIEVADYADFYSSLHHATNLGRLFRPDGEPLLPNWRRLPVGYHGRAGTVVVSGTDVLRPSGIVAGGAAGTAPAYQPSAALDIELEVGAVVGLPTALGEPMPIGDTGAHLAGLLLLNDWSARDIQSFEYQPLGPFLGKSFATSVSPWLVTLTALEPYRVAAPAQDPTPEDYLRAVEPWAFDVDLEVLLETDAMRAADMPAVVVSRTNFADMYWTVAQQLAHLTANGASLRTGDLLGSGTVSGVDARTQAGSFIELTWRGERPIELPTGESRAFLADGDRVTLRGACGDGDAKVGFGEVTGVVRAAPAVSRRTPPGGC
jgi:fumarylacetoacetase